MNAPKSLPSSPSSIDDILIQMDELIDHCIREKSKLGYFAVLYRNVTSRVRDLVNKGHFDDNERMIRLDINFASRYLQAIQAYRDGTDPTHSWKVAFDAATLRSPVIFQHLLLGMNAHINLDLAIATAQTVPGQLFPGIQNDFQKIMSLLNDMVDEIQERIEKVSPFFGIIDQLGEKSDERFAAFGIKQARNLAWITAQSLANDSSEERERKIKLHDHIVATLANGITRPGITMRIALLFVRMKESNDVPTVINALKI